MVAQKSSAQIRQRQIAPPNTVGRKGPKLVNETELHWGIHSVCRSTPSPRLLRRYIYNTIATIHIIHISFKSKTAFNTSQPTVIILIFAKSSCYCCCIISTLAAPIIHSIYIYTTIHHSTYLWLLYGIHIQCKSWNSVAVHIYLLFKNQAFSWTCHKLLQYISIIKNIF